MDWLSEVQKLNDQNSQNVTRLNEEIDKLDLTLKKAQIVVGRAHTVAPTKFYLQPLLEDPIYAEIAEKCQELATTASQWQFYRYNNMYGGCFQRAVFVTLLRHFLANWVDTDMAIVVSNPSNWQSLVAATPLGPDLVSKQLGVPFLTELEAGNENTCHLTDYDYLLGIVTMINELSRLAFNSVTAIASYNESHDTKLPFVFPQYLLAFIKNTHAGLMVLNLKNDKLRRSYDSIKYDVKKVEEIIYDLTVRRLV
ncbi:YALI0F03025p [Yarrowia lipolytica CLIB122]|jgi:hypothetical protein|uniref:YALI0F03025p n=2 Tax=Yarrowia lipolytica TaxID=4952 RepID=Q6C332_YARLI|nr:YALI0F03025p [Yarrowia lipolytica CLIB122]AOW06567.1 hypothetical protein YALI1_F04238g [Yarrowia lipolytica]KAB8282118.1 Translin [Yarrowia lipolytica]KAE8172023.1 Translin [Yarrowia lipolytica]KAJ8056185.1 Translin [Yarrowia lipolytica]RDW29220.1 Translin [Yarrowia lipolytica]|eukprot:XP_504930.1 YALI0F03025p [Yarrowia lipolytica CLIB122]